MSYIAAGDVTDKVLNQFDLSSYITESDSELDDLAEELGVRDATDIEDSPLHYKAKRFLIAFVCMRVAQDNMGVNNVEVPEVEKYVIKYNVYRKEYSKLKGEITAPMLTGDVDEMRDRAGVGTGILFRS
jgi:hypothetical protein